jgi:hypothetical protein
VRPLRLEDEAFVFFEEGFHFGEQIGLDKGLVRAEVGPRADEASFVAVAEPVGDNCNNNLFTRTSLASTDCSL